MAWCHERWTINFANNHTWTLTHLPSNIRIIGCKWVFRIKQNPDGSILKCKSRLVDKGYHQVNGFEFQETFSPLVKHVTVRVILTLYISRRWHITQLDVNNAFLNSLLSKEVYKQQPPSFLNLDTSLVFKLNKSIYGLK